MWEGGKWEYKYKGRGEDEGRIGGDWSRSRRRDCRGSGIEANVIVHQIGKK